VTDGGLPYLVLIIAGIGIGHFATRAALSRGVPTPSPMAGGDGSQAIVAEHGLPYACIPSGTRNHFASTSASTARRGGPLDGFVDGAEFEADLGEVNGRMFVNNVQAGRGTLAFRRANHDGQPRQTDGRNHRQPEPAEGGEQLHLTAMPCIESHSACSSDTPR
jgi:hypothetical protein